MLIFSWLSNNETKYKHVQERMYVLYLARLTDLLYNNTLRFRSDHCTDSISFLAVDDDDDNIYSSYMLATSFSGGPMSLYEQAGLRYYYNCFCGVGAAVGQWLFLSHSNHMYCRLLHSGTR